MNTILAWLHFFKECFRAYSKFKFETAQVSVH